MYDVIVFSTDYNDLYIDYYQLDLVTPVISPCEASFLKHNLHIPNFLM